MSSSTCCDGRHATSSWPAFRPSCLSVVADGRVLLLLVGCRYVAVFDPLDGSSNIDAAISTGTIFGIFLENEQCLIDPEGDISEQTQACLINTLQVRGRVNTSTTTTPPPWPLLRLDGPTDAMVHVLLWCVCAISPGLTWWRPATACTRRPPSWC